MMTTPEPGKNKSISGRLAYRIALIVLLSIFVGASVYSINARRLMRNAMPMPFGFGASVVLSGSMEPTLAVNDLVIVLSADDYSVGDIVVYQDGDLLVIHRVVEIGESYLVTRGDANNTADDPVDLSLVKGRMAFAIPLVGLVVRLLQTLPGTLVVIVLAVFLMNRSWKKEREEDDRKLDEIKEEIRRLKGLDDNNSQESSGS